MFLKELRGEANPREKAAMAAFASLCTGRSVFPKKKGEDDFGTG